MSRLNVLYQFNEKYAPYAGVSITSLFENNKQINQINVYILGEQLAIESVKKLGQLAKKYGRNIFFKETDTLISKMKEWGIPAYRGSYAANLRLFLPLILDENVSRILYLDADTIVSGGLTPLFNMKLEECSVAMCLDSLGGEHKKKIGLGENDYYFNSGVILFDLDRWKEKKISENIIAHIKEGNTHYPAPDQDLLNVVCKNDIALLDARYNMQPVHLAFETKYYFKNFANHGYYTQEQIESAVKNVVIYHFFRFLGEFPWNKRNLHPDNDIFDLYLEKSPWSDYEKTAAESDWMMKVEKRLYCILPKGIFLKIFSYAHRRYVEKSSEISYQK